MSGRQKPSAIIEARSRAALQAAIDADPTAVLRMAAWQRELFGERLVVREVLRWLDEQAAAAEQQTTEAADIGDADMEDREV